jgi:predicted transposase/invertase (TIGR01784 family)
MEYNSIHDLPALLPFKDDYIFKSMLTRPDSELIRNSIISAFTGLNVVQSAVMQNDPPIDMSFMERPVRFDVTCITDTNERVNIEMQAHKMAGDSFRNHHENLRCRSIYYTSKLYVTQNADHYSGLSKTFHIMICDFEIFEDSEFLHKFRYSDGNIVLSDICCIIYVELPKIKGIINKPFAEMTDEERWAVLIECVDEEAFSAKAAEFGSKEEFKMAINVLSKISKSEMEQLAYLSRLKYINDERHNLTVTKKEGIEHGLKMGMRRGIKEGLKQGLTKGITQTKLETAKNALALNLPIDTITAITGLSADEIMRIAKQD